MVGKPMVKNNDFARNVRISLQREPRKWRDAVGGIFNVDIGVLANDGSRLMTMCRLHRFNRWQRFRLRLSILAWALRR